MSMILPSPGEMFPDRHRWTVADCYRLAEQGFLEGRNELLDGEIINKMGQNPAHSYALKRLMRVLATFFGLDLLWIQSPITLPAPDNVYNEPEPDIAVTREAEAAYVNRHPGPGDVRLVVEVSDTTLRSDLQIKVGLYARADIPEYWILDLNSRQLHILRQPSDGAYTEIALYTESESVAPLTHTDIYIAVADVLPPAPF